MAESRGSVSLNHHLKLGDDKALVFGDDGDCAVRFNGRDLLVNPRIVGSSSCLVNAFQPKLRRMEFDRACDPVCVADIGGGAATGTAGDINVIMWPHLGMNYVIKGTQTLVAPAMTTVGLNIGMDQTDDDGVELRPSLLAKSDMRFVVGTDPAFYLKVKIKVEDVSGTDDLAIGFRKFEADQAAIDDYDEMAALNVISGNIKIETILNGGATTTTDTTQDLADAGTVTLEVRVSSAGVVTYQIDGAAPTVTAAFTFDNAEVLIPFIYFLHASDVAGKVEVIFFECGHQTSLEL